MTARWGGQAGVAATAGPACPFTRCCACCGPPCFAPRCRSHEADFEACAAFTAPKPAADSLGAVAGRDAFLARGEEHAFSLKG